MRKFTLLLLIMVFAISISFAQSPPTVTGATAVCSGSGTTLTAAGESGATFAWYDAETGGNLLASTAELTTTSLTNDIHFYVEQTTGAGTSTRTDILVYVTPIPSPLTPNNTMASSLAICIGESTDLSAEVDSANSQLVHWYDAATGGNLLGTSITGAPYTVSPTVTTTYYAQSEVETFFHTFNYTGGTQTFTVPTGINSIEIDAYGAQGGNTYSTSGPGPGQGGRIQATMNVTPGEVLNIYVGGVGASYAGYGSQLLGGWNGGGNGSTSGQGGGGGGATDIRQSGTSLNDRVLVAGGAGGKGPTCTLGNDFPHGGGLTGGSGSYCSGGSGEAKRGLGGSQIAGGRPGCWHGGSNCAGSGSFGQGGNGGSVSGNGRAGGGGGGWYGGGGGTYHGDGGGGSSYTDPVLFSNVTHTQGIRSGHGYLTITYSTVANCASTNRESVTVTVNPLPEVIASSDAYSCPGVGVMLTASGADTYLWTPGNLTGSSVNVDPSSTITYTVIGTITSTGCTSSDQIIITVSDVAAPTDVINCEGITSTLTATGAVDYSWEPGGLTGASITVTPAVTTEYIVTGTDPSGCLTKDTVNVSVNPLPVTVASNDTLVVNGESANVSATGADTYTWSPGSLSGQSVSVTPTTTTIYTVIGTYSLTGCTATDDVEVSLIDVPSLSGVTTIKAKETTQLIATGPGTPTFNWYDAETGGNFLGTVDTFITTALLSNATFYVALHDGVNESPRVPINVTAIDSTVATVGAADPTVCPGSGTDLGASLDGPGFINWFDAPSGGNLLGTSESGVGFPVTPSATQTYYAQGETRETAITFDYTGSVQTFTVPAGVTSIEIDAYGGQGGNTYSTSGPGPGQGGRVQATMNVTPGEVLNIYVGGVGASYAGYSSQLLGGWNGGGNGSTSGQGGGGGGATDIRQGGTSLNDRVLVAGGAGGKGPTCTLGNDFPHGGGLTGGSGSYCSGGSGEAKRGLGGSQTAGGRPGCWHGGSNCAGSGSFGQGGNGGSVSGNGRAGGGGGGWYGGGGGTYHGDGGGGSSYTKPRVFQNISHAQGVRSGHGQLIITYSKNSVANSMLPVTVTVEDVTAPVPDVASLPNASGDAPLTVSAPSATDLCEGSVTATTTDPTTYWIMGTYTINWEYEDSEGNSSNQSQTIVVNTTLPVELSSFRARCEGDNVALRWTTDSEINSSHFNVQRSKSGLSWEEFGRVESIGDSRTVMTYNFRELSRNRYHLYRLQQVDRDGTTAYSDVIEADCSNTATKVKLYPNPTSGRLTVSLEGEENETLQLQLVDELGQLLEQREIQLENGWGKEAFSLDDYPSGFYELLVTGERQVRSYRIIKLEE